MNHTRYRNRTIGRYIWHSHSNSNRYMQQHLPEHSNQTRQNPKHLTRIQRQIVHSTQIQTQEPGNLDRKPETDRGTGQKKQLPALGYKSIYLYTTLYFQLSNNIFSKASFTSNYLANYISKNL